MPSISDLPEHILHDIVSTVINSSRFRGWQISLRLINREFNEAVLHVCFLRLHLEAVRSYHLLDCINGRHQCYCAALSYSPSRQTFSARFNLQTLLVLQNPPGDTANVIRLLRQWKLALSILRGSSNLEQLSSDQIRFYSTCSQNVIFNNIPSAILAEALDGCVNLCSWEQLAKSLSQQTHNPHHHLRSPEFWVALCGCALGDLQLVKTYIESLTRSTENASSVEVAEPHLAEEPTILLKAAIKHARLPIMRFLLARNTNIMSETHDGYYQPLSAAIFSRRSLVLATLLEYTPRTPKLLDLALWGQGTWLISSDDGSAIIRLLVRHFAPLTPELRARLIVQSCAVGDIMLLEEFMAAGPLFSHRIYDSHGHVWTHLNFAIRCGNAKVVGFLLDHGILQVQDQSLHFALEQSVAYNQIECFRQLYLLCDLDDMYVGTLLHCYRTIGGAENAEDIMSRLTTRHEGIFYKSFMGQDRPLPSCAQSALWYAINNLRFGNVQFLLEMGVRLFQWQASHQTSPPVSRTPFEIEWPYFNLNRKAFIHTQVVLDAFSLPKLQVIA